MAFTAREGAAYACLGWAVAQMPHPAMAGKWADALLGPAPPAAAVEPQVFRCTFPQSAGAAPFFYLGIVLVAGAVLTLRSVRRRRAI